MITNNITHSSILYILRETSRGDLQNTKDPQMASQSFLAGLMVAIVAISTMSLAAAATNHVVGGSFGWNIPQSNPSVYSDWSSANTFALGDTLEFKFQTGQHQVIHVTKAGYDQCNTTLKIGNVLTTGPATVTLNSTGTNYFICGIPGHCTSGQKLSITVGSSPTPATSPAPSSSSPTPPTTPSSSAPTPPTAAGPASSTPESDSGTSAAASLPAGFLMVVAAVSVASSLMF